jgi:hypothetical protein
MLEHLQKARWAEWEAMLLMESSKPNPLLHSLHILCVQFLCIELLSPGTVRAGGEFCSTLGDSAERLLTGCPINAHTWPELLRMVLLARSAAQAPKKRAVALTAMLGHGAGNASIASAASAALGGGHAVSVWSVSTSAAAGEGEAVHDVDDDEADDG